MLLGRKITTIFLLLIPFLVFGQRTKFSINDSWKFSKGDFPMAALVDFDDSKWELISIPHTWNASDTSDEVVGYYRGPSWYRKTVYVDAHNINKEAYVYFEGANQETELFINGKSVGKHKGGYGRFCFDATSYIKEGSNLFAICVDNSYNPDIPPLSADFTFFGGIYRDLYLIFTPAIHIATTHYASSGVYIKTPSISDDKAIVEVVTLVDNKSTIDTSVKICNTIFNVQGLEVASKTTKVKLDPNSRKEVIQKNIAINNPELWDLHNGNLYRVVTTIYDSKNNQIDLISNPLGLRSFSFDPQKGFSINGSFKKLVGTNRHQDYHLLGNALPDEMHIRDINLLNEMGGNFLRVSHYPQDPVVMEMCDKLGIVTSVEIPVVNAITPSSHFNENCIESVREMIYQNFNNPSVIIWAYMNEVMLRPPYDKNDEIAKQKYFTDVEFVARNIENEIRSIDSSRYTMLPCHGNANIYEASGLTKLPMILGWNLYQGWYSGDFNGFNRQLDELHARFPNQAMIVTEYGADVDPRLHSFNSQRFDFTAEYGDLYHEHYLGAILERPFVAGANIWNLNDFYSESRRDAVPNVNNKGITGTDRELKDSYLLYKAHFNPSPMIRIGKHTWKTRGGVANADYQCVQPVKVYTNASKVDLFVNGLFLGDRVVQNKIAQFDVPFIHGKNVIEVRASIGDINISDLIHVDFNMLPQKLTDPKIPFESINVMFGSKRYFEDRTANMIWLPEQEYQVGGWGYIGGEPVFTRTRYGNLPASDVDIKGTKQDPIFQTQRKNIDEIRFDVPDGEYAVYLYLAELVSSKKREELAYNLGNDAIQEELKERVFNVSINGNLIFNELNIARQFGEKQAVIQKIIVNTENNEGLSIKLGKIKGDAVINAIRVYRIH